MLGFYETRPDPWFGTGLVRDNAGPKGVAPDPDAALNAGPAAGLGGGETGTQDIRRQTSAAPSEAPQTRLSDWSTRFLLADPLDIELMRGLRVVTVGRARLQKMEGAVLSWFRETRGHDRLGFSCFGDMARAFQMAPRTAQEHVLLHRLLTDRPVAEAAFVQGDLSLHQVLALAPILKRGDLERNSEWIETAAKVSVAELRNQAREAAETLESEGELQEAEAEVQAAGGGTLEPVADADPRAAEGNAQSGRKARIQLDAALEAALEETPGRMISFHAPPSVALAWDRAMEISRAVLGWDAPPHKCVEAILAEASPETSSAEDSTTLVSNSSPLRGTSAGASFRRSTSARARPPRGGTGRSTPPRTSDEPARRARHTLNRLETEIKDLLSLEGLDEQPAADMNDQARIAARRLRRLRSRSRPLRVLYSRILRDLHDTGAVERLGFSSMEAFGSAIGLSERAFRELRNQAQAFQDHPALEKAFSEGRIGSEQIRLLSRIITTRRGEAHVARAESVTYLQLARETRLLERIFQFDRDLAARFPGPFPHHDMEAVLTAELIDRGCTAAEIEKALKQRGLDHPVPASERVGAYLDPACNPVLMRRLEALFEMLVLASADRARLRSLESLAVDRAREDRPPETSGAAGTQAAGPPESAGGSGSEAAVGTAEAQDPEGGTQSHEPRRSTGSDRQTSARLDTAINRGLHEDSRIRIRFWAPEEVAGHWDRAVRARQEEFAFEVPGPPRRIEKLPVWAAVLMLLNEALEVWQLQDPERIPTQRAILERDEYHCRIPWCSLRRMMEGHHVEYRSHNGSNRRENREADCHGHHRLIHDGYMRVRGTAPHGLIFELGVLPDLPPLLRMHGEKILEWGW